MTTAVHPILWAAMVKRKGAAWYIGAGERYTLSGVKPKSMVKVGATVVGVPSNGRLGNSFVTPLGSPVVPDEYNMSIPAMRLSRGASEC